MPLRPWYLQRRSSTIHRGAREGEGVRHTRQRVAAADSSAASHEGRAINASVRPRSAANCNRRDSAILKRLPSEMTTFTAGLRSARSIAHRREASSGRSRKIDCEMRLTTENTEGTEEEGTFRSGGIHARRFLAKPKSLSVNSVFSVVNRASAHACGQTRRPIQTTRPVEPESIARQAR
jgi:hypothetical protein